MPGEQPFSCRLPQEGGGCGAGVALTSDWERVAVCVCGEGCKQWPAASVALLCESEERSSEQSPPLYSAPYTVHGKAGETENIHFYIRQPAIGSRTEGQVGQPYSSPVTPKEKRTQPHSRRHTHAHTVDAHIQTRGCPPRPRGARGRPLGQTCGHLGEARRRGRQTQVRPGGGRQHRLTH